MSDFEHLVPLSARGALSKGDREEMDRERVAGKEHRFVTTVLRALRVPSKYMDEEAERLGGYLDFVWLWNEQMLPFHFAYAEVGQFDVMQLYMTPTKSPVWKTFREKLKTITENTGETEIIMPFTCRNVNQRVFVMHNVEHVIRESKVFLTFIVRNKRHFIQPWKEVIGVIHERWGQEGLAPETF